MDEKFKTDLVQEIIKLKTGKKSKDDDSDGEETWGSVEEIWGSALKISSLKFDIATVTINAGDLLSLDFDFGSDSEISAAYLEELKNELSEKTNYDLNEIDINQNKI